MRFYTHRPPTLLRTGSQIIRGFATAALYFLIFVARAGKAGGEEGGGAGDGSGGWGAGPGAGAGDAGAGRAWADDELRARQGLHIMKHTGNQYVAERAKRAELCSSGEMTV